MCPLQNEDYHYVMPDWSNFCQPSKYEMEKIKLLNVLMNLNTVQIKMLASLCRLIHLMC